MESSDVRLYMLGMPGVSVQLRTRPRWALCRGMSSSDDEIIPWPVTLRLVTQLLLFCVQGWPVRAGSFANSGVRVGSSGVRAESLA